MENNIDLAEELARRKKSMRRHPFCGITAFRRCDWKGDTTFVNAFPAESGSDWCGCGRIFPVSSFPFQSPIPFMRFDVTTSTVTTWRGRARARSRAHKHRVQAHKQNDRVLLECQSGILVFFAKTPQNMYVRELHTNDRCGNSRGEYRPLLSRIRLPARVVRSLAPCRLIAAWKLTFPF